MSRLIPLVLTIALFIKFAGVAQAAAPSFPDLPQAASSLGAVVCDGWLYVYGGHIVKTHSYSTAAVSGRFHRLKLDGGNAWEELPGGPSLQGMNLAAANGKVYRVGGMQPRNKPGEPTDNHSVAEAACYDPPAGRWEALQPLPEPRSSHDVVALNGKLYVVGGWQLCGAKQETRWPTSAYVLDLNRPNATWQAMPQPFERRALTAAAAGGKLYVLGGFTSDEEAVQRTDVFDPQTDRWTKGPDFPGQRAGFGPAACEVGGRLCLSTADCKVHRLSPAGDAWELVGTSKTRRIVHRVVPLSAEVLLAVGGANRDANVGSIETVALSQNP